MRSFPGIGITLASTISLELINVSRFPIARKFASYARLIVPEGTSAGKTCGKRSGKIGNPYLNWAFQEAVVHARRSNEVLGRYGDLLESRHGKKKAKRIFAHRYGKAVYFSLKRQEPFNLDKFLQGKTIKKRA